MTSRTINLSLNNKHKIAIDFFNRFCLLLPQARSCKWSQCWKALVADCRYLAAPYDKYKLDVREYNTLVDRVRELDKRIETQLADFAKEKKRRSRRKPKVIPVLNSDAPAFVPKPTPTKLPEVRASAAVAPLVEEMQVDSGILTQPTSPPPPSGKPASAGHPQDSFGTEGQGSKGGKKKKVAPKRTISEAESALAADREAIALDLSSTADQNAALRKKIEELSKLPRPPKVTIVNLQLQLARGEEDFKRLQDQYSTAWKATDQQAKRGSSSGNTKPQQTKV